jgi:hypothetical protein
MGREQVRRLDLNLLLAFEALIAERNVTRAAPNLGLTIRPVAADYAEQIDRSRLELLILPEEAVAKKLQARSPRLLISLGTTLRDRRTGPAGKAGRPPVTS